MRNAFLSDKLKQTNIRLLIIDDNQIRYNQIVALLESKGHSVNAHLLDDVHSFEKQLNTSWDIVLFGRAYDFKVEQALTLIHHSQQPQIPFLLLNDENYNPSQYLSFINKGVYDLFNLDYPDRFYIGLVRTLSYSRSLQTQKYLHTELAQFETRLQNYSIDNKLAVATIHEGIHVHANAEYLALFGLKNEDEIIGLPLLDILQPEEIQNFKKFFKRISQHNFEQPSFEIHSQNPHVESPTLKLEFLSGNAAETVQLTIATEQQTPVINTAVQTETTTVSSYEALNRKMLSEPANQNTLVVFRISPPYTDLAHLNPKLTAEYLQQVQKFLQEQTQTTVYKVAAMTYFGLIQAASTERMESKLRNLQPLLKAQLIPVEQDNYAAQFEIGAKSINAAIQNSEQFEYLLTQAFAHPLKFEATTMPEIQFSSLETESKPIEKSVTPTHKPNEAPVVLGAHLDKALSLLNTIEKNIEDNSIHLKYQQLYDKQDTELYIYEVTAGVFYEHQWLNLADLAELKKDQSLSVKLDRWILVEACKQLHNFRTQFPNTKLMINLNLEILFNAPEQLLSLIEKLLTLVHHQSMPLILQFPTIELAAHIKQLKPSIQMIKSQGVLIAVRDFGINNESLAVLEHIQPDFAVLNQNLSENLGNDSTLEPLQNSIEEYKTIYPVDLILPKLDDMTNFANAWNVDVRYLQGDYFQKRSDALIDVQGH
ncbi:EAL domain-containing protein [Acinetobacter sp. MD2(2019)]|uniref:EAL domain-containing protein n=1 Tax=Acinetobacter sp. MD2(2019) TaxID=2605273 RepID=UPI002D1EC3B1|nr:EAL domain-containing protein [Acinetobacter sp. MD2(2019)]MEB3754062.1 EAL domain-containing protein [Acinetobacter sp. MD2(2019)]